MKCPDALEFAIENSLRNETKTPSYSQELKLSKIKEIEDTIKKYFRYSEIVTLIIDTEDQTCIVEEV